MSSGSNIEFGPCQYNLFHVYYYIDSYTIYFHVSKVFKLEDEILDDTVGLQIRDCPLPSESFNWLKCEQKLETACDLIH